jgi:hypothetical protein
VDTSGHLFLKKFVDEIWGRKIREAYEEGVTSEVEIRNAEWPWQKPKVTKSRTDPAPQDQGSINPTALN